MIDSNTILRNYLESHNFVRNSISVRKQLNMTTKQLAQAIESLRNQRILLKYTENNRPTLFKTNREKLPFKRVEKLPKENPTLEPLKQYLSDKLMIKNISKVANEIHSSYPTVKKAVEQLVTEGILDLHSKNKNGHCVYRVKNKQCIASR